MFLRALGAFTMLSRSLLVLYLAFGLSYIHLSVAQSSQSVPSTVPPTVIPIAATPTPTVSSTVNPLSLGIAIYPQEFYGGSPTSLPVPSLPMWSPVPIPSQGSFSLSSNVWVAMSTSLNIIIFWASCPKKYELPPEADSLSILDIQFTSCEPPCSGSSVCQSDGTCTCLPGFTGQCCEDCKPGYYGPLCLPCDKCEHCDEGISGSGCYTVATKSNTNSCNCLHGECDAYGQCNCNPGWIGTACAQCKPGFYLDCHGDCKVCYPGCIKCADGDGSCDSCQPGLERSKDEPWKCLPPSHNTVKCSTAGTYYNSNPVRYLLGPSGNSHTCSSCASTCSNCTGPLMSDCIKCADSTSLLDGTCVSMNLTNGVCDGSNGTMVADICKHECDTCPANCTTCEIPNFSPNTSTIDQLKCTGCLPGLFLSNGTCAGSCPVGTFPSPHANVTCTACSPSYASCKGTQNFRVACTPPRLTYGSQCLSTCPDGTFAHNGTCVKCHPDCAKCSGFGFSQCTECFWFRPVLTSGGPSGGPSSGRCLRFCSPSQYWDPTALSCQNCHQSCLTCSASGSQHCLSCREEQGLFQGQCVPGDYVPS